MKDILELIDGHLDHTLTPVETRELGDWLRADPANARRFAEEAFIHSRLRDILLGEQFLHNRNEIEPEPPPSTTGRRDRRIPISTWLGPVRPSHIVAALVLVASLLVATRRNHKPGQDSSVTMLAMAANAEWEGAAPDPGKPLATNTPLRLKTGCVEISLPGGGTLIIEGPAAFTVTSPRTVALDRGRLTARMPGGGLVVETPAARITDLGTEFGVSADANATRVDVFQGRVQTAPAVDAANTATLTSGQAANISAGHITVDPAGALPQRFVRSLALNVSQLDLVDLLAGGDGTSHLRGVGIDMRTGDWGELPVVGEEAPDGHYHRVPALPVVDGIFIPDSTLGPSTVDSAGHKFPLPTSYRGSFMHLWAGGAIPFPPSGNAPISSTLAGVNYSQDGHGLLEMHSNKGLTLDLTAVRRLHPGRSITRFASLVGNTRLAADNPPAAASAYILVDGQPRFSREAFTAKDGALAVDVLLKDEDRFLTLVITDGGDSTITFDHVIWADPVLQLNAPRK